MYIHANLTSINPSDQRTSAGPRRLPLNRLQRQPAAGAAGELIGQRASLPVGMSQYRRTQGSRMTLIEAEHLLAISHGAGDKFVGLAGQSPLPANSRGSNPAAPPRPPPPHRFQRRPC